MSRSFVYAIERTAWKAFKTEFYPCYDFRKIADDQAKRARARCAERLKEALAKKRATSETH
jgi:hypothetical protein